MCGLIHYVAVEGRQAGVTKGPVASVSFKVSGRKRLPRYLGTSILEYLEQCGGLHIGAWIQLHTDYLICHPCFLSGTYQLGLLQKPKVELPAAAADAVRVHHAQ